MKARDKLLSLLGICRKAGKLAHGFEAASDAVKSGGAALVLIAADISPKTQKEARFLAEKHHVEVVSAPVLIDEIAHKTGKRAGVLCITDRGLAQAAKTEAARAQEEE